MITGIFSRHLSSSSGASSLLTVGRLFGAGVGFLLQILIARYAGSDVLGEYYVALSLAAILSVFLSLGYPWIVAPVITRSESKGDPELVGRFLRVVKRDTSIATMVVAIPLALLIWHYPDFTQSQRMTMLVGIVTAPVYALMRMNGGMANALRYFHVANLPELLLRPLIVLILTSFLVLWAIDLLPVTIVSINLCVALFLSLWMASFLPDYRVKSVENTPRNNNHAEASQCRKLALPMMFPALFIFMFADLDIFIIGMIMPSNEAGIFGVCMKIAALFAFAVQITHQILLRDVSDAHEIGDKQRLHSVVRRSNNYTVIVSIISLLVFWTVGQVMLGVFGSEFTTGYKCLLILGLAQIVRAAAGPAIQILMITDNQKVGIPVYALSILVLLLANILLVPTYGLVGAATAVVLTFLFCSLWLNYLVKRETGYRVSIWSFRS